ncbi:hypothetical protein EVAR_38318_1 [Eumeta japonica]|uniref:Uncharacterized protein n=1 Tax=Eumeta variegata TaxID=151549 RepID=A0A4C1W756_EUMVA|nr:hypothetical protein EVAR_38318_1 [Eumeta japonica]
MDFLTIGFRTMTSERTRPGCALSHRVPRRICQCEVTKTNYVLVEAIGASGVSAIRASVSCAALAARTCSYPSQIDLPYLIIDKSILTAVTYLIAFVCGDTHRIREFMRTLHRTVPTVRARVQK